MATKTPGVRGTKSGASAAGSQPPVKSLGKGLRVLEMLLAAESVGTNDVAAAIVVDKGAASRILRTLVACGFAVQGGDRRYRALARTGGRDPADALIPRGPSIRERARPLLLRLHELTGETAHLGIRADDRVLYLDKVDTELPLRVDRPVGTLAPLHCTALGKIFLAHQSAQPLCDLPRFTARTAVDAAALRMQLRAIVADGYAIDDEEFAAGIRCVAAPLRDARARVVAAIGVSSPAARMAADRLRPLGTLLKELARDFPG
jgi:DNA-binding IclR family transcriptional regulator